MLLAAGYNVIGILILLIMFAGAAVLVVTHLIGPHRTGKVKDAVYESGVDPVGDARQRFNVRFYLVAVMFVIFDVELIFLYPWAVLFPRLRAAEGTEHHAWASALAQSGYTPAFFAAGAGIFFFLLLIGFLYEWRKGIFKWD